MQAYNTKPTAVSALLWSIALPGFGQLLNHKYIKGIVLILLELAVNVMGNLNEVIVFSFHGHIEQAISEADYGWLMFYPCLYLFAIWDAYKDAGGGQSAYAWLPLVSAAYIVTIGLIYSPILSIAGVKLGPMWSFILSIPVGLGIGAIVRSILLSKQ